MIRVALPAHLRTLASADRVVEVEIAGSPSLSDVLDTLEDRYPMLRGTIRDHSTHRRRDFIRFFACGEDISHESPDAPLPAEVVSGEELLRVVGAMAGG